ncbi:tyrosine protein phosphatase [Anaerobacillus alkalidiazotrophicus]|uniref:Tyrosine-protein phosphatase n=1 Tax=Anaerobacillus alkalidiazotrophicus TaxID=472963 RepID=A0A1S2MB50_9BACI|nr:CpsB/CapC family capsule biosynthesis tyrosine phosphatase [Anaerobacillus alkalidiazotrophicus]OIJ21733.1 tyrosine protein phosphatase [Anaerobacillus alkalidiazotrophicus]
MIDIHCHILPNVDDGAKDMDMALEMAKAAVADGIDTIIASPHHRNGQFENTKSSILDSVERLNERLTEEQIPLTILPGQEARIFGEMVDSYLDEELLTVNNLQQYLLVELSSSHVPRYINRLFYDLQQQGVTPIIVHPERNAEIVENPEILHRLVKEGALTQVTAGSVTGHFGKKIQKFSIDMITHNLTHFVATDAHNLTSRPFNLREAYEFIEDECGIFYRYLFLENAEMVVDGRMPLVEPPEMIKRKKFLGIF